MRIETASSANVDGAGIAVNSDTRRAPHMIGVRFPGEFPAGLNRELEKHQVHVSCRADSMRVSPHLYNDATDIDRLFEALRATL